MDPKAFRLPTGVVPHLYETSLRLDPARPDFEATAAITVEVRQAVDEIVLHGKRLAVERAVVERNGKEIPAQVAPDEARETVTLRLPSTLAPGPAVLRLRYTGRVGKAMAGLYLSKDGAEQCLATQCEATDARAILPCFDEPAFKARFAWRITAPKGYTVLANGPLGERTEGPDDDRETWQFAPTTPMSSYLAAFAVGRFASTDPVTVRNTPHRVWALAGKEVFGLHGRDFAVRLQEWFEDYFDVPYAFAKYDQLAVPSFSFGAMENAGLVVFRPSYLLLDPKTASWRDLKGVDLVVAHEFAHMWFGNWVTMRWWDDLWLNEAFAEWIAHKAVDALEPSHEVWLEFQGRTTGALSTDALERTHAIYHPVATPHEASELFDAITYGKGSAVLRMLEGFLGEKAFRKGLRTYMQEFARANAQGRDLWRHLAQASGRPVERIMAEWVERPGHPVVAVAHDAADGLLRFSQRRARSSPVAATDAEAAGSSSSSSSSSSIPAGGTGAAGSSSRPQGGPAETWLVPMLLRYADDAGIHEAPVLLAEAEGSLPIPLQGRLRWLAPNADDGGFYRSDPDDGLLDGLVGHWRELTPSERTALLRDQWGLVRSGDRPVERFLGMVERVATGDDHYAVVEATVGILRELERLLEGAGAPDGIEALRRWTAARYAPAWEALGVEPRDGEPSAEAQRRATLLRAVAGIGRNERVVAEARRIAQRERQRSEAVDANLATTAVAVAAQLGDVRHWETHLATYKARRDEHASPQEVDRYLYALPAFRDPALVARLVGLLEDGTVPNQSVGPLLRILLGEPHGQGDAWRFVKERWGFIRENLGDAWTVNVVEAAGALPPRLEAEVVAFFDANLGDMAQQAYGRTKERIHERRELLQRVLPALRKWAAGLRP